MNMLEGFHELAEHPFRTSFTILGAVALFGAAKFVHGVDDLRAELSHEYEAGLSSEPSVVA